MHEASTGVDSHSFERIRCSPEARCQRWANNDWDLQGCKLIHPKKNETKNIGPGSFGTGILPGRMS